MAKPINWDGPHDYAREERPVGMGASEYRLACSCGKISRWVKHYREVMARQDAHADEIAIPAKRRIRTSR